MILVTPTGHEILAPGLPYAADEIERRTGSRQSKQLESPASAPRDWLQLGPYEILGQIGAGGMGEVYGERVRGSDARSRSGAAAVLLGGSGPAAPLEQGAKAAGVLNHSEIAAVFDIGSHDDAPYVVQELLEGETLRLALAGRKLPQRKVIDYALRIAHGLSARTTRDRPRDLEPRTCS